MARTTGPAQESEKTAASRARGSGQSTPLGLRVLAEAWFLVEDSKRNRGGTPPFLADPRRVFASHGFTLIACK